MIAMATVTDRRADSAFPKRIFSKKRASGNKDIDINVANNRGKSTPCDMYINASISTRATKLAAKSSA
jgi:hypothetical protein